MKAIASIRQIDYRILIMGALIAALCAVFWLDSRYPSLQGKASADPDEALATPLGFEKHWAEPGEGRLADQGLIHAHARLR